MGIIYQVKNKIDGKRYIGKTSNSLEHRRQKHEKDASDGSKLVFHRALRKHGFAVFQWDVLAKEIGEKELNDLEISYIRLLKTKAPIGYNMTDGGNGGPLFLGRTHSEETKEKMRRAKKGKTLTEEHKKKIGLAGMGRFCSIETRRKRSISRTGIYHTEETKAKISRTCTGKKRKPHSEETKAKISMSNMGRVSSDICRKAVAEANRRRVISDDTRNKMSKSALGNKNAVCKRVTMVVSA